MAEESITSAIPSHLANPFMSHNGADRTINAFFYGLYMDAEVLATKGVKARGRTAWCSR